MKLDVTRDVVTDLWTLCRTGAATADSRALVDAYLAGDPALAQALEASEHLSSVVPPLRLSPDAERRILDDARQRARWRLLVIGGAVATVGFLLMIALVGALFLTFGGR